MLSEIEIISMLSVIPFAVRPPPLLGIALQSCLTLALCLQKISSDLKAWQEPQTSKILVTKLRGIRYSCMNPNLAYRGVGPREIKASAYAFAFLAPFGLRWVHKDYYQVSAGICNKNAHDWNGRFLCYYLLGFQDSGLME